MYTTNNISTVSSSIDLLINALPKILSGDAFYEKFARRLNKHRSDDLTVEAARLALKASGKGVRHRYNKFSRMTACVALTGCLARGILPINDMDHSVLVRACERLVKDVPMMLRSIRSWKQQEQVMSACNGFSDPSLN
jgi:hypothetical protein